MWLYRTFLRLPTFRGKASLDRLARKWIFTPKPTVLPQKLLMHIDPLEWAQSDLLRMGCLEPLTIDLMRRLLRAGDTYVDVGAHVGFHTLVARQCVGTDGHVVAVEPQPYNCERILQNWHANGFENIELHIAVAGGKPGSVRLNAQSATDKSRLSLVLDGVNDLPQQFHVPMVRIGDIVSGFVRLAKIDAEGFEAEVLSGMESSLPEHIIVESLPGERRALDWLLDHGFELRTVEGKPLEGQIPENNVWARRG